MDREKILADELAENNNAIDAFQLYADTISIGRSEFNVLNSDGFYDALAYFLATLPSEKEIAKGMIEELVDWQRKFAEVDGTFNMKLVAKEFSKTYGEMKGVQVYKLLRADLSLVQHWLDKEAK